ncbi:MAG: ABC transporter permease [Bdellovibrionota bacterium]
MSELVLDRIKTEKAEKGRSLWQDAWSRLTKNKAAMLGFGILSLFVLLAIFAPWIAPYSYETQDLVMGPTAPSASHWFGTDTLGRDMYTRVLYGARISLMVGFIATFVSLVVGVIWGTVAGFIGGRVDSVMMRIVDIMYSIPFILLVILLMVMFNSSNNTVNLLLLFFSIGAVEWLTMARIVRGQVLNIRKMEFIEACYSMGLSNSAIIFRHLIPNVLGPIIVYATLTVPTVMLLEAFLSFLGLGVQPPMSSWGILISNGVENMEEYPWLLLFPGLTFSATLFSLNFLGDGLRDALDPKASKD